MDIIEADPQALTAALSLPENLKIRNATLADLEEMAKVTHASWQQAFNPFLPQDVLDRGTHEFFQKIWLSIINKPKENTALVISNGRHIVACGASGKYRTAHNPVSRRVCKIKAGELYRGYVLPDHQNKGLGQALLKARLLKLYEQGYQRAYTWIYAKNEQARAFYEKHGAVSLDSALGLTMNRYPFEEVCYGIEVNSVFHDL
ncbi:GNAT family N-acetyltransferase [Pseudoalteromonas byunsanensis]|uniref:GNAT family N-acetyltransferase n=1 Tax=Pseudoalteromonas byunsanensis TaxID=327939 RepID=A0A1S1NCY9_9GAMM|nr:GNAT family N-acetyltransferase [Pseudoalteromonas byunsanensis]OHU97306.1 GNAT family N-acetyltransferase [Pseudoalteromonas byunsanensis]